MRRRQRRQGVRSGAGYHGVHEPDDRAGTGVLDGVLTRITAIDVTLPPDAASSGETDDNRRLELVIRADGMRVNYPPGVLLKPIPLTADGED